MKISVLIPAYNNSATIRKTLDSVLAQTRAADEILVLDDGSTDQTASILDSYEHRIKTMRRTNGGVASARNILCSRSQGDLLAFLDADDLWSPRYLEVQEGLFKRYPKAVAFYTGHVNFAGFEDYDWKGASCDSDGRVELISALEFFKRYNRATGPFASMSYCCVSKQALTHVGEEIFRIDGVEDSYLCYQLALLGPVVYADVALVAYRVTEGAQSANRLKMFARWINAFEMLSGRYEESADSKLLRAFEICFASKRRSYSRILFGAGRVEEARKQLRLSMKNSSDPTSVSKSLGLLALSYLPRVLQPTWPKAERVVNIPEGAQRA